MLTLFLVMGMSVGLLGRSVQRGGREGGRGWVRV